MFIAICHESVIEIGVETHSWFRISEIGGERNGAKVTTRYLNLSVWCVYRRPRPRAHPRPACCTAPAPRGGVSCKRSSQRLSDAILARPRVPAPARRSVMLRLELSARLHTLRTNS